MNELRLLFARSGDALNYRIATSWGAEAGEPQGFVPFLTGDDDEDLRWYLEEFMDLPMGGAEVRAERIERSLGEWGRRLFGAIFDRGDHRELYNELLDSEAPRLLTVGTKDLDVLRLPWELMADARGPLTRRGITVRRQLETAGRLERYDAGKLPLRILLAVSRPDDTGFLDPRHTTRAMLDALTPLGDGVVVDFCRPATLDRLERMLTVADRAGRPYHIVHFDGHGTFLPVSQIGALCFEKEEDASGKVPVDMVRAERIGALLAAHKIPLAILEACRSGQVGNVAAFRGVAPALIEAGVGSVLSMSHAVHVEATKILLERFYEEIVGGATIGQALEQGRAALIAKPDRWLERGPGGKTVALKDWFLPNLYQRGKDLMLVPGGAEKAPRSTSAPAVRREPAQGEEPGAFPGRPMYGFFGRARELHQIERRFLSHRAVLLYAMGGMGKTSLAREAAFWGSRTGLFPDGACFVSFEQAGGAERAIRVLGSYFDGVDFEKRSAEEQRKRALQLFHTKKVLVVWDNFESVLPKFQEGEAVPPYPEEERAEIYKTFREWTADEKGAGRLLVTCRPEETGLGAVCRVELGGLAKPDALWLLYRVMQVAGVKAGKYEREALEGLIKALEYHPLSIELVGPHLKEIGPKEILEDFRKLLDKFTGEAEVERNRSLRASLEFSLRRLSTEARDVLRWVRLFRVGVFEPILLAVSQTESNVWETVRTELEATAVVRIERNITVGERPFLRFHPTLAHAEIDREVGVAAKERYVDSYRRLKGSINESLTGPNPNYGMAVAVREEANFWQAIIWAIELEDNDRAAAIWETLNDYLQRSGRLRERNLCAHWVAERVQQGGLSKAAAHTQIYAADALLSQGRANEAIDTLNSVITGLKEASGFDTRFALEIAHIQLGRTYYVTGAAQDAIPVLKYAVTQCEAAIDEAQTAGRSAPEEQRNLAAALGSLAHALIRLGNLDAALAAAERSLDVIKRLELAIELSSGLGRVAHIFMLQGRYTEADDRYVEALDAARLAGDKRSQGQLLQHRGVVAYHRGRYEQAAKLFLDALRVFQEGHYEEGVMQMFNLLGALEQACGRIAEARAWIERSCELAALRHDREAMGMGLQNLGVLCQADAMAAQQRGDQARTRDMLVEAIRFVHNALDVWRLSGNELMMATSLTALGQIQRLMGNLDQAEEHSHRAREIRERLGLKEVWQTYATLADITRARGNDAEAAAWEQKRDAILAELRLRAGASALSQELVDALSDLTLACAQAGIEGVPLTADTEEAVSIIEHHPAPAPLDAIAPFLRALAAGKHPAVPPDLPPELADVLTQVLDAARQAKADR